MKKKITLLTVFVLLFSSLAMLKAQPPAGLTEDQWKVLMGAVAQASREVEKEKTPLGKLLTEVAHKDVRPLIIEYVAAAPTFREAAAQIVPLALTSKDMMEESIKGLMNRITQDAKANQKDRKDYATGLLFELANQKKPVPLIAIEALIRSEADVNVKNRLGNTPLHLAAWNGHKEIVDALIGAKNADVNVKSMFDNTPLIWAAQEGHTEIVYALIRANADVNAKNKDVFTPLHWAAWNGHKEIVDALIRANADVNAKNKDGFTPLHWAAHKGHTEIVYALIKAKADKTIKNNKGRTAYDVATDPEIKRLLE